MYKYYVRRKCIEAANISIASMMAASDGDGVVTSGHSYIETIIFDTHSAKNIFIIRITILLMLGIGNAVLNLRKAEHSLGSVK